MKQLFNLACILAILIIAPMSVWGGGDLDQIRKNGVLRHLGVPYANFVTGTGSGLDVELIRRFAEKLGVEYRYVKTDWKNVISDLTGQRVKVVDGNAVAGETVEIKGDVIANGLTILPWREQVLDFSRPTFPTQVWLISSAGSEMAPIIPSGNIQQDIARTKEILSKKSVLGVSGTCLDPELYKLGSVDANVKLFTGSLNELAPAVLDGEADTTLLDVPDSLVALAKWPGQIKVVGPVSEQQAMGVAFRKGADDLQKAFAEFLDELWRSGAYREMVKQHYPDVFYYYADFFDYAGK